MLVTRAPAQVARNGLSDFGLGGLGALCKKWDQRHQEARCAEAALQGVRVSERLLQRMQRVWTRRQTFDGYQVVAVGLDCEHEARANGLPIKQDGARAAHAVLTTHVRAAQAQLVAKEVAQQEAWFDLPLVGCAIDGDSQGV
jgi:hypothetical protein